MRTKQVQCRKRSNWLIIRGGKSIRREYWFSSGVAIVCTFLLHLWFFYEGQSLLQHYLAKQSLPNDDRQVIEWVLEDPQYEMRFVETNPYVEEAIPDETQNYAARAQIAAQENPNFSDEVAQMPHVEGDFEDSHKILQGDLNFLHEPEHFIAQKDAERSNTSQDRTRQDGVQNTNNRSNRDNTESIASQEANVPREVDPWAKMEDTHESCLEWVDRIENCEGQDAIAPELIFKTNDREGSQANPSSPRPRIRVDPQLISGPLMMSPTQATSAGAIAIHAKLSQFGGYQQRMVEAVSYQWNLLLQHFISSIEDRGKIVVLKFNLIYTGDINHLTVIGSDASEVATLICKDAILSQAPFDVWPEDMIMFLGKEQEIEFRFFYR